MQNYRDPGSGASPLDQDEVALAERRFIRKGVSRLPALSVWRLHSDCRKHHWLLAESGQVRRMQRTSRISDCYFQLRTSRQPPRIPRNPGATVERTNHFLHAEQHRLPHKCRATESEAAKPF